MARPGSFGVKARLPRVEVLQFHQFAVPDWSGRRCASRSSRMAPAMSRNRRKEPPISAVAVPEWGRSSASPSRAWVRASLGPKPLPTGSPSGRKRPGATRPEPEAPDRRRPPRRLVRNRVRNIRSRRCRRESPSRNPRKSACGGDARICGNRAGSCQTPDLPACASRGRRGIAVAHSSAVLKRLNMTQLLCASPCLLFRSAPPSRPL